LLKEKLREILNNPNVKDLIEPLGDLLENLINDLKPIKVIISGSLAKGKFVRGLSDIDILVIIDYEISNNKRFLFTSLKDTNVEITIVSKYELEKAIKENREFYVDAIKNGIVIFSKDYS
jgi:predicted nucleotidyltransferase